MKCCEIVLKENQAKKFDPAVMRFMSDSQVDSFWRDNLPSLRDPDLKNKINAYMDAQIARQMQDSPDLVRKYKDWVKRQYYDFEFGFEDLGTVVEKLQDYEALKTARLLKPEDANINNMSYKTLITKLGVDYSAPLKRVKQKEQFIKAKRDAQEVVLIDNDKVKVTLPLNFGACYVFNHGDGIDASMCTGSSGGPANFETYFNQGPIIQIFNKEDPGTIYQKWQIHAPSRQLKSALQTHDQQSREDFPLLFPGLFPKIVNMLRDDSVWKNFEIPVESSKWSNLFTNGPFPKIDGNKIANQLVNAFPDLMKADQTPNLGLRKQVKPPR